jgi:hypothetical protein
MAKVKVTENGNYKVTMNREQFELVSAILGHVRRGMNGNANEIAELAKAMHSVEEPDFDMIRFTTDDDEGNTVSIEDVTIETD